ncbi:hypothetical protein [Fodinibius salsisoli]|uniref:Uncharacterized protein n=1 Tax=Fodinibius salsisoli TaxID=2820877 RepID=A0ABT3PNV5_9BACT|nr:hypothetical protein [Fodinibius salsisoli]MCW9707534.1 hypothetical protein [Fodinibius salsisoli]
MKIFKKTYHHFSALLLVLLFSSVLMPTALSAATLLCDMEMHAGNSNSGMHASADVDQLSSAKESCAYQEVCIEALSGQQNEAEAIAQVTPSFTVIFAATYISDWNSEAEEQKNAFYSETVESPHSPPIFILNSTFLN